MKATVSEMADYIRRMFQLGRTKRLISNDFKQFDPHFFSVDDFHKSIQSNTFTQNDVLFLEKRPIENYFSRGFQTKENFPGEVLETKIQSGMRTMRVNSVWRYHPSLAELYKNLNSQIKGEITINAYYSKKGSQSFSYHYDMCDCVILAIQGEKEWKFLDDSEEEEKIQKMVLRPGDGIFIPRGLIHKANCLTDSCLHLSFAFDASGFFSQFWSKDDPQFRPVSPLLE